MSVETTYPFDQQVITQLSQSLKEPDWLLADRLEALELATQLPLPKVEQTNISGWNFTNFKPYTEESPVQIDQLPDHVKSYLFDEKSGNLLVQKNSSVVFKQLADELAQKGIIFTDLTTASREHGDLVKKYLTQAVKKEEHRLAALNAALWTGGVFLYVPRNVEVEVPFQSLFWAAGENVGIHPHILIIADENSRVEFVANYVGDDLVSLNNSVIEVFVRQNAQVRVATINNMGKSAVEVIYRRALVDRDGKMEWIIGDLSEGRIISDNTSYLNGQGGTANVKAVALGVGKMRANITSNIHHFGTYTNSDIQARSVMKDEASSILNSITKIEKGASKSDGQQSGKVLMLNPKARGDANPILLIDENDVKAGHAASVGRIDPIQLYYLMSRGITKEQAEKLIIFGFLDQVISEIPSESLRQNIIHVIEGKFGA
ncbi:Fe-S cluster assembly protein SufD [Thermoflavimicrobium dichotomicum]|uniref:Fe-S cluster assembly protein SufD n=1 Tax=Thermoflavimicrobium dichotomicum TaxID=46223 RepID=A0A1I3M010_9BACL|nr:Fe-S cluster assembly protein SufD [Thermoflavimicrobium dichotomicum]SFI90026.1 Fe-S cluster assembly protein SufD [Thermoflavimicrobium dichotomicum]